MARQSYTFPDDVKLDSNGVFGVERHPDGGWCAFNDARDVGVGTHRLWTSPAFNTDSEARLVQIRAIKLAEQKREEAAVRFVSATEPKRGNRGYMPHELEGEAQAALAGKKCDRKMPARDFVADTVCGGKLAFRTWGVRVQPSGTTIVGVAQCATCGKTLAVENAL